jgi:hypothetical protein
MISGGIDVAIWPAYKASHIYGGWSRPFSSPWNVGRVGQVLLRGNDVLAKLGRFPRRVVIDKQPPQVPPGNSVKVDPYMPAAIRAGQRSPPQRKRTAECRVSGIKQKFCAQSEALRL